MKRRRRILWLGLLIVVVGSLAWLLLREREPAYGGKTLSAWLKGYENLYSLVSDNKESDEAIRHIGTNALPFLAKMLVAKDSKFKVQMMSLADKQSLINFHFTPALRTRAMAYRGLQALGKGAKPMIPMLVQSLNDGEADIVVLAIEALGRIGLDALEPLTNSLSSTNIVIRICITSALCQYRKAEEDQDNGKKRSEEELSGADHCVIPILLALLKDNNRGVRMNAIYSLGELHQLPEDVVPVLEKTFNDPHNILRNTAAYALANFGVSARSVVPSLLAALEDPDEHTRRAATNALRKIDPQAAQKAGLK